MRQTGGTALLVLLLLLGMHNAVRSASPEHHTLPATAAPTTEGVRSCGVDRIPDLTPSAFDRLFRAQKPVIFGRPVGAKTEGPDEVDTTWLRCYQTELSEARFRGQLSTIPVLLYDTGPESRTGLRSSTLGDYMQWANERSNDTLEQRLQLPSWALPQVFNWELPSQLQGLADKCPPPEQLSFVHDAPREKIQIQEIGHGLAASGLPWHWHGPVAANLLVSGKKRWLINLNGSWPPGGVDQSTTSLEWIFHVLPTLSPQALTNVADCVLEAGEMIYVPDGLAHMTFNVESNVFVTFTVPETKSPRRVGTNISKVAEKCSRGDVAVIDMLPQCYEAMQLFPHEAEFPFVLAMGIAQMLPISSATHHERLHNDAVGFLRHASEINPLMQEYIELRAAFLADLKHPNATTQAIADLAPLVDFRRSTFACYLHATLQETDVRPNQLEDCLELGYQLLTHYSELAARTEYLLYTDMYLTAMALTGNISALERYPELMAWYARPFHQFSGEIGEQPEPITRLQRLSQLVRPQPEAEASGYVAIFSARWLFLREINALALQRFRTKSRSYSKQGLQPGLEADIDAGTVALRQAVQALADNGTFVRRSVLQQVQECADVPTEAGCRGCLAVGCAWCTDTEPGVCIPDSGEPRHCSSSRYHIGRRGDVHTCTQAELNRATAPRNEL